MAELSDADIKKLLADYLHKIVQDGELDRATARRPLTDEGLENHSEAVCFLQAEANFNAALETQTMAA